ncbi:MAG: AAA family ATPase [Acidobacteria bacterium]|nr:AAA family ATPase [Acidobacteriota bacterium]
MTRVQKVLNANLVGRQAEKLDRNLHKRIVGQEEAVDQVVKVYQTYLAGMNNQGRPIGTFLFMGPTGSGKTRMVEALAESLVGDARAVIKIDCAEFQHSHEIAKLIGSPPGYLGHRETHPLLSQETLNQYQTEQCKLSFVLFDEIEKASDALWNLLLGILDKATLTLGDNRRVDFTRSLIFMTSNLGSAEMSNIISPGMGFVEAAPAADSRLWDKISRAGLDAARKKFTPEFLNRIDKSVVFKPLGDEQLKKILDLELGYVQQRIFASAQGVQFVFQLTDAAKSYLLREGTDMKYGARHLKRAVERHLVYPLSNLIATEQVHAGDMLRVDLDSGIDKLIFCKEAEGLPIYAMASQVYPESVPPAGTAAIMVKEQQAGHRRAS